MIKSVLLLLGSMAAPLAAQTLRFQHTNAIDVAVEAFTGRAIGEEGGARTKVDARLKLAACPLPQLDWRGTHQDAVVVRCNAPAWRIYVPVKTRTASRASMIAAAAPLAVAPAAAKPEPVIRRGDPVTIEAGSAGFAITRDGIALGDAAPGARFMVKVDPAKPPVQAVAIESGRAGLPGWER